MPTTYAHDLFGQKVYRQLPDQVKEIIRKNGELYRIGLLICSLLGRQVK